jgi:spermidine synthase
MPWLKFCNGLVWILKSADLLGTYAPLFFCLFLFLLPATVMGIGFPLALQAWSRHLHRVGRTTGTVYGLNTIGAVLGGVLTGFVLIPLAGAQRSITLLGLFGLWLGAALVWFHGSRKNLHYRIGVQAAAALMTVTAFLLPADLFERWLLVFRNFRFIAAKEGITATVAVYEGGEGAKILATSGVVVAGDGREIRSAQKTLGHLGVFLNDGAEEVLSIGFGSGETTWCLAQHDLGRIDCVEIAPELVEVSLAYFSHINLGDRLDQKVKMHYMDGKNFMHLTDRRYDVIINGADIPHQPGSAPMFALEHFQSTLDHLKPGGLFITKMHMVNINRSSFDSILGTFLEVFPYVTLWFPTTKPYFFFYLVGSAEEQFFSPLHIEKELKRSGARESFAFMNLMSAHDVLGGYMGDKSDIRRYLKTYRINSDDRPFVEFNLREKEMRGLDFFMEFIGIVRRDRLLNHIDWTGMEPAERAQWRRDHERSFKAFTFLLQAYGEPLFWHKLRLNHEGLLISPLNAALREQESQILKELADQIEAGAFAPDDLIKDMNSLAEGRPEYGAPWLVISWALQRKKDLNGALRAAEDAVRYAPYSAPAQDNLGYLLVKCGQADRALEPLNEALRIDPDHPTYLQHLAAAYARLERFEEAEATFRRLLD